MLYFDTKIELIPLANTPKNIRGVCVILLGLILPDGGLRGGKREIEKERRKWQCRST